MLRGSILDSLQIRYRVTRQLKVINVPGLKMLHFFFALHFLKFALKVTLQNTENPPSVGAINSGER